MADHEEKHGEHTEGSHGGGSHGGGHGHGGGGHAEGEHEGAPEWLISFADNVMLQMGFFVILLALNMGPKGGGAGGAPGADQGHGTSNASMIDFVIGVREAFNNPIDMNSTNPDEAVFRQRVRERSTRDRTDDGPEGDQQKQQHVAPSDHVDIGGIVTFADHSAAVGPAGLETIQRVAHKLRDLRFIVELRGHVSPFENPGLEGRMKLSYERAMAVARALIEQGVPSAQLRVVSCGDGDRAVARSSNHAADRGNQRVQIVVTKQAMPPDPYSSR